MKTIKLPEKQLSHQTTTSEYTRSVNITKKNGEIVRINFEDLQIVKLIGKGQLQQYVNKCFHEAADMYFAVKRISRPTEYEKKQIMDIYVPMKTGDCLYTVKFYGAISAENSLWILTECLDASLDRFYAKAFNLNKTISAVFLSKVAFSVLSALQYLKKFNIMHRDVKPSNILINYNGEIKICDFGVSGILEMSRCKTKDAGCRSYMAPERIDPDANDGYDVKADIWSLGLSLMEIATGKYPYKDATDYCSQIEAIYNSDAPKLPEEFGREFDLFRLFLSKCLEKNPKQRKTLSELLEDEFIKNYTQESLDFETIKEILDVINTEKIE